MSATTPMRGVCGVHSHTHTHTATARGCDRTKKYEERGRGAAGSLQAPRYNKRREGNGEAGTAVEFVHDACMIHDMQSKA